MKSSPHTISNHELDKAFAFFSNNGWRPFSFQEEAWKKYLSGYSGLVNAPTGFGKTYSLAIPILSEGIGADTDSSGVQAIWIAPIRALMKEIKSSFEKAIFEMGLSWKVGVRSGDTSSSLKKQQISDPPQILITTPESLHVLFGTKNYQKLFKNLKAVVVDEWHELMGSKRGVQVELGISRLRGIRSNLKVWGISATVENVEQALSVLTGTLPAEDKTIIIRSKQKKHIAVESIMPDDIEDLPWSGYLGVRLLKKVIPIIRKSRSTIIFTNTRSQCEIWYQYLLQEDPDLAGIMAMHHGSISKELRDWVEDAIHDERLKVVVSTSSLDLGVDFRPVETVIQVGSPKGVSRFIQRAGRSGHQPLALSRIYFVPTHSLELVEGAALRTAISRGVQEPRIPYIRSFDVLIQYLMTLAVSNGFVERVVYDEIKQTHCYSSLTREEWLWVLGFLEYGGPSLHAYDQYQKISLEEGLYKVTDRRVARMHRMSIGTIVSDASLYVHFQNGKRIGSIEEWFISSMHPGDVFWFAGQALQYVRMKDMTVYVKRSNSKKARVPSWGGGRMPLSSMLSNVIREKLYNYAAGTVDEIEMEVLKPLLELQRERSVIPGADEFLIERISSKDGHHLLMYPFEGRYVHEGMAALLAKRISEELPISFSLAMNDYGFELLSDQEVPESLLNHTLFSSKNLQLDIQNSLNSVEMARRRFRDISKISGLIFQGYPGNRKRERHLQSSSSLLFDVFHTYEPDNLLFQQTYDEVMTFQLEETRMRNALKSIGSQRLVINQLNKFSPLSFPIVVDRLSRERLSSERLEDRIKKMVLGQ
jgi:ATP-dependent Lhr-like helicase